MQNVLIQSQECVGTSVQSKSGYCEHYAYSVVPDHYYQGEENIRRVEPGVPINDIPQAWRSSLRFVGPPSAGRVEQ